MDPSALSALVLIFCISAVVFTYTGYPVLIYICSRLFGRKPVTAKVDDDYLPFVSLLIAAKDEEENIEKRLTDALLYDYPAGQFEIVIASDGSTDQTNAIVREISAENPGLVRLLDFPVNRGKAAVLKDAVPQLRGEIVVLSDANTHMRKDAIRLLSDWFAHPDVGAVCGKLVIVDPTTGNNVDSLYWKYETFLKKCESRLGALLGSNGAIYAIRKDLFPEVPVGTIIEDFYIPLEARRRSGCRIIYDTRAIASEESAPNVKAEFRRRSRIGAGGFQSIGLLWRLLSPAHGWVSVSFFCHKVLRWLCPFFLIAALVANAMLLNTSYGSALMVGQVAFYTMAVFGQWLPSKPRALRFLKLPTMFVFMNAALFVGFFRWLFGTQKGTWARTERTGEAVALADANASPQGV